MNKVNPNQPAMPIPGTDMQSTGIPLKLELAARFMQGILSSYTELSGDDTIQFLANQSLRMADTLINAYNQQEGEK